MEIADHEGLDGHAKQFVLKPGGEHFSLTLLASQQHWTHLTTPPCLLAAIYNPLVFPSCAPAQGPLQTPAPLHDHQSFVFNPPLNVFLSPMALATVVIRYLSVWLFDYILSLPLLACKLILCTSP